MTLHTLVEQNEEPDGSIEYQVTLTQDMDGRTLHARASMSRFDLYDGKAEVWKTLIRRAIREGLV